MMRMSARCGTGLLCLALLGACGTAADHDSGPETATSPGTPAADPDSPRADAESETADPAPPESTEPGADDPDSGADDADGEDSGGVLTVPTLEGGAEVTMTAPEGWDVYGVDEAITDFDIATAIRGGDGQPLQTVAVTDQQLGLDASGVFDAMHQSYAESTDQYSELVVLDPIIVDGVEFIGFEAVADMSSGPALVQYWFGDVGGTVLGIYLHHGGDGEMPAEVTDIRDSLTFD